jgi:hypothetical protein
MKEIVADSGIAEGEIGGDLKKSDPGLNKNVSTPPAPGEPEEDIDNDEQYKQMIMKMIIKATIGSAFGAIGSLIANSINPKADPNTQDMGEGE